jgi:hypothetical protein
LCSTKKAVDCSPVYSTTQHFAIGKRVTGGFGKLKFERSDQSVAD